MNSAVAEDLTLLSSTFPRISAQEIIRDDILAALDMHFEDSESNILILRGRNGLGKTTVMSQFCRRYPNHALSLFVSSAIEFSYDPTIVREDIYYQLNYVLGDSLSRVDRIDGQEYRSKQYQFTRHCKRSHDKYCFVVDGLDEIEAPLMRQVLDLFPIGVKECRFIISADRDSHLVEYLNSHKVSFNTITVLPFSEMLHTKYFDDLNLDKPLLRNLYNISKGIPGKMESLRRIIQKYGGTEQVISTLPSEISELFSVEWSAVDLADKELVDVLSILAFDPKTHTITSLSSITGVEREYVLKKLTNLEFIHIDTETQDVTFESNEFRSFASNQLVFNKNRGDNLVIESLMKNATSPESLSALPAVFERTQKWEELSQYLNPHNFNLLVSNEKSLTRIEQHVKRGLTSAEHTHNYADLLRFSLHSSAIEENFGSKVWRSEIEARIALGQYDEALTLAHSTKIAEDQLHLLAIVAKEKRENGLRVEDDLLDQIRRIYQTMDTPVGERGIELACDLVHSCSDLAIDLVEKSMRTTTGEENSLDWALATLSLASSSGGPKTNDNGELIEQIDARITNPLVKKFSIAAHLLIDEYSAEQVIKETEKLETATDQLFLLRLWASSAKSRVDAGKVLDHALRLAISTTNYAPNMSLYSDLAKQLPNVAKEHALQLIKTIDDQVQAIVHLSAQEEFVQLELQLAESEFKYDREASKERIRNVYLDFLEENDLTIKAGCISRLMSSLTRMGIVQEFEATDGLETMANAELATAVETLLNTTAEHNYATGSIVESLSGGLAEMAFDIAMSLNTKYRRDHALSEIIEHGLDVPVEDINLDFLFKVMNAISNLSIQGKAIVDVLNRIREGTDTISPQAISESMSPWIAVVKTIRSAPLRCRACCYGYELLESLKEPEFEQQKRDILNCLKESWDCIDIGWIRVDTGFSISKSLAKIDTENALKYLSATELVRESLLLSNPLTANSVLWTIRLVLRAYQGLISSQDPTQHDLDRIEQLIASVPSVGEQCVLLADLATRLFLENHQNYCDRIVSDHVRPLLEDINRGDATYYENVVQRISPALFIWHSDSAMAIVCNLTSHHRDKAYSAICDHIIHKTPLMDPVDNNSKKTNDLTFQECFNVLKVAELMEADYLTYHYITIVTDSLVENRSGRLSRQQRIDLYNKIDGIVTRKFPTKNYIEHDGYKVAGRIQLLRLSKLSRKDGLDWDKAIVEAKNIPNVADRTFVLGVIAESLPMNKSSLRNTVIDQANQYIESIPVMVERMHSYGNLASHLLTADSVAFRKYLNKAMSTALKGSGADCQRTCRNLIDLAYRVDPELASNLVSMADDDEARESKRTQLARRIEFLELKKELLSSENTIKNRDIKLYPNAAWMTLSSMNSSRTSTVHIEHTHNIIQIASRLPLAESYPLFALVIQNAVKRLGDTNQIDHVLRPIFESTLLASQLSLHLASRGKQVALYNSRVMGDREDVSSLNILARPGERNKVLQFIRSWLEIKPLSYLKISEPFFRPEDLEMIRMINEIQPDCRIIVLTSRKSQEQVSQSLDQAYQHYWHVHVSDSNPPDLQIVIVGISTTGASPIHDRWWVSDGVGISLGTSNHSAGVDRTSGVSVMDRNMSLSCEREIDKYVMFSERYFKGERLDHQSFYL